MHIETDGDKPLPEPDNILRLDLRGLKCPLPALHTRRALDRAAPGTRFEVVCTDPMAVIDIPHMLNQHGHVLEAQERRGPELVFRIRRGAGSATLSAT